MANVDAPNGFRVTKKNEPLTLYPVDSSNSTAIFKGDLVKLEADGNIAPAEAGAGNVVVGVAVGLQDSNGKALEYLPASTAGYALVADDPRCLFVVQADSGTSVAASDVGATADHVAGAGSTISGDSAHELDSSDIGTGGQLQIIGKEEVNGNDWGEHVNLIVRIAEHAYNTKASI